jgi:hypothetical protein
MAKKKKPEEKITKAGLKERGWTDAMIQTFLPEPDEERPNPHHKASPHRMKLYKLARVERVEKTKKFLAAAAIVEKRRASVVIATATRKRNDPIRRERYVNGTEIQVKVYPEEKLIKLACKNYNERKGFAESKYWEFRDRVERRGETWEGEDFDYERASPASERHFLERITVNYIRHHLTTYDMHVKKLARMHGDGMFDMMKKKVLVAIATSYPWLANECARQAAEAESLPDFRRFRGMDE